MRRMFLCVALLLCGACARPEPWVRVDSQAARDERECRRGLPREDPDGEALLSVGRGEPAFGPTRRAELLRQCMEEKGWAR